MEAAGTLPDTAAAPGGGPLPARPIATRRRRWPTSRARSDSPSATTSPPSMRRELPRSPAPRYRFGQERPGSWCPWSRRGLRCGLRHGGQPLLDGFCPAHAAHFPQPGQHHGRRDADTLSANIYTVPRRPVSLRRDAHLLRHAKASLAEDAHFYVTPRQRACACSPGHRGHSAHRLGELRPPASRPRLAASPPRRPGKTEPSGRVADDDEGLTYWRRCHKQALLRQGRRSSSSAAIARLGGTLQRLRPTSARRHGGRRLVRGVERGHARLNLLTSRATRRRSPISARRVALRKRWHGTRDHRGLPLAAGVHGVRLLHGAPWDTWWARRWPR